MSTARGKIGIMGMAALVSAMTDSIGGISEFYRHLNTNSRIDPPTRYLAGTPRKEHQNTKENARRVRQMEKLGRKP